MSTTTRIAGRMERLRSRLSTLAGRILRITVRDVIRFTLKAAAILVTLVILVVFALVHYPATQVPAAEPASEVRYLDQGWGTTHDSPLRETYYYTPQGSSLKDVRYDWFVHLERPWGQDRFADPEHLRRLGFIVDPVPSHGNPDQLPLGFTKHFDAAENAYLLDITCAACHTGQLNVSRNGRTTAIRIDGGAAMHAFTSSEIGHFLPVLVGSMASTYINPVKFNRFARRVLGDHYDEGKSRLREEFREVLGVLARQALSDQRYHLYPTEEGFGRTDALARIGNTVFGDHITPANYRVGNGPVSYPYLWNIWMFDWVQYNASVSQPMARNVGEVLGVGAKVSFIDQYGRPLPASERYRTSVLFDNLLTIESTLQRLKPPPWPEDLLGRVDREKAARGQQLFQTHCVACHGPHPAPDAIRRRDAPLRAADEPLWQIRWKDVRDVGTDPNAAMNFYNNRVDLTRMGLDPDTVKDLLRRQLLEAQARGLQAIATVEQQGGPQDVLEELKAGLWTDDKIAQRLDGLDLRNMNVGAGLNIVGLMIREKYYAERNFSPERTACYEGFGMLDLPQVVPGYKPRPLQGVWATPPFLHNGSVPNLYELLSPAHERSRRFFMGRREFDPVKVGYVTEPLSKGGFWFDTRLPGNLNTGHEFRAGWVPYDENDPQVQYGVIGPELTPDDRWALIEYLKIHEDGPMPPPGRLPVDCSAPPAAPATGASR